MMRTNKLVEIRVFPPGKFMFFIIASKKDFDENVSKRDNNYFECRATCVCRFGKYEIEILRRNQTRFAIIANKTRSHQ